MKIVDKYKEKLRCKLRIYKSNPNKYSPAAVEKTLYYCNIHI